jgi:arylsulfatase A-like enzyme
MLSSLALVVVIVVDQLRTDELLRAQNQFTPYGISQLIKDGVFYDDAHHPQFFNMTCPGHTALSTGALPALNGIMVNNDWDKKAEKTIYCVSDEDHKWLGADLDNKSSNIGTSAKRILVSTLGDEMKLAWKNDNKVVSVSVKDRAAIALGGHAADGAYWYAPKANIWTTSDAYAKKLPPWLIGFNKSHAIPTPKEEEAYESSTDAIRDLTDLALTASTAENLGHHSHPDILWISYSTHDFVAHKTGDDSEELRATLKSEDQNIGRLVASLKKSLGAKKLLVVLTGDHGAGINIDEGKKFRIPGGRQNQKMTLDQLNACLAPEKIRVAHINEMSIYLDDKTADLPRARAKTKECLLKMSESIGNAYTRDEILGNQVPQTPWLNKLAPSYNLARGADVIGVLQPYWNSRDEDVTNHETPYDYDSWVPLVFWWQGAPHRKIHRRVEVTSVAPTLSRILLTRRPSGCTSDYLTEVLDAAIP